MCKLSGLHGGSASAWVSRRRGAVVERRVGTVRADGAEETRAASDAFTVTEPTRAAAVNTEKRLAAAARVNSSFHVAIAGSFLRAPTAGLCKESQVVFSLRSPC